MKPLLGLYREEEYSPGRHASNDVLILERVGECLRERGCAVDLLTLPEIATKPQDAQAFSMCQGKAALKELLAWESRGARLINRPQAALNTHRDRLPALMHAAGIAFPPTELISTTSREQSLKTADGLWLKRGDVHASISADVQRVNSESALEAGLAEFARRGIARAVLQAHRAGDEMKFYGVGEGDFFHWFYSGAAQKHPFAADKLQRLATDAASAAGLDIFGGDVIVSPTGELTLIDLNDWPSFAPCREAAAHAIAEFIIRRFHAD
ncbi:MAG: hypothetical protein ACR2NX_12970 [Chthoniobacterales bacterium]